MTTTQRTHFRITGISSLVGRPVEVDRWAERARIPNRKLPGAFLTGEDLTRIVGIHSKSWDPERFRDFGTVVEVAREALHSAHRLPAELDAVLVVTCTPYQINLDQDAFRLLRALEVPDSVPVLQIGAGCAGMARAMAIASRLTAARVLVVSYNLTSLAGGAPDGSVSDRYLRNGSHPLAESLWASAALFSDGAAAVVLERDLAADGVCFYSRDSLRFGDEEGFHDPLIHFPGGGAATAALGAAAAELSCYGMASDHVKRYYGQGMMLNHRALLSHRPAYVEEVARIYTHQASPGLVDAFVDGAGLPRAKVGTNVREFGNLVTPCTLKMLHDDLADHRIAPGDEVCVSVVGAGPERGGFIVPVAVREVVPPAEGAGEWEPAVSHAEGLERSPVFA